MPRRYLHPARRSARATRMALTALAGLLFAAIAHAAPPPPILPQLVAFPGSFVVPMSARSAGLALADRWLGDHPAGNPAGMLGRAVQVAPMLLHVSRQDLRADNTDFDETPAFVDVAGGWIGAPLGGLQIALYAYQPVSRTEDNAYQRGRNFNPVLPAVIESDYSMREFRGGLALSYPIAGGRVGVAGEWTHRADDFNFSEVSGSPEAGTRRVEYSGSGFGGQIGARFGFGEGVDEGGVARRVELGAALHLVSELSLDGTLGGIAGSDSSGVVTVKRESGIEAGLSAAVQVVPTVSVLAAVGGRTEQAWEGFDVASGDGVSFSIATEYHDARDPWTLRIGFGIETMNQVPEDRASLLGLGFGYAIEGGRIEVGVVRRSFERQGKPTAFEDRVVASVLIGL